LYFLHAQVLQKVLPFKLKRAVAIELSSNYSMYLYA